MIYNKHGFYEITVFMCNDFKSVTYHFDNHYCSLSEAVTIAKNKYPKLKPSAWNITPITSFEYIEKTGADAYTVEKKMLIMERQAEKVSEWREKRKTKKKGESH